MLTALLAAVVGALVGLVAGMAAALLGLRLVRTRRQPATVVNVRSDIGPNPVVMDPNAVARQIQDVLRRQRMRP